MARTQGERRPTIVDVARLAEVSLPTVTRSLTGSVPVSPRTRARVMAAIEELGYRPNGAARALVQGRQPIVGVISGDTSPYGRARKLLNIEDRARRDGYVVAVVVVGAEELSANPAALDMLMAQPIVGVIVLDYNTYDRTLLRRILGNTPITTVAYGADPIIDVPAVFMDDRAASTTVTQHLLELGHRTVHHVAVPGIRGAPHSRELGWRAALTQAGAPVPAPLMSDWSIESGKAIGAQLARDPEVTAVFCSNDQLAFAVMHSLHEHGLRVPDDVSVAGLDDEPMAELWVPGLTTHHLDFDWAGAGAYDLLARQLTGTETTTEPDFRLVTRGSTAAPSPHRQYR